MKKFLDKTIHAAVDRIVMAVDEAAKGLAKRFEDAIRAASAGIVTVPGVLEHTTTDQPLLHGELTERESRYEQMRLGLRKLHADNVCDCHSNPDAQGGLRTAPSCRAAGLDAASAGDWAAVMDHETRCKPST